MVQFYLTMPQPGETIREGNLVRWLVSPGSSIKEKDPVCELETEKAVFEYESPFEGKIVKFLVGPGSNVPVGEPMALFEVSQQKAAEYEMLGIGKKVEEASSPLSPLVRKLIREHGLSETEVASLQGSGPGSRITKEDILEYLKGRGRQIDDLRSTIHDSRGTIIPCSPIRLRIAEHMVLSKKTIPHAHTGLTIDLSKVVDYREKIKKDFEKKEGFSLGIASLLFPSLKKAILAHPLVNASFMDEKDKKSIVVHKTINLGMAVDTDRGLYVVVIRNADQMGFIEFAKQLFDTVGRAKKNRPRPEDLTGMTFTLNNHGFYGTTLGVQIILPPQSTTLGMGQICKRPWVVNDQIQIRHLSDFTMAFDHRVMDGRDAGLFLSDLKKELEGFSEKDLK